MKQDIFLPLLWAFYPQFQILFMAGNRNIYLKSRYLAQEKVIK